MKVLITAHVDGLVWVSRLNKYVRDEEIAGYQDYYLERFVRCDNLGLLLALGVRFGMAFSVIEEVVVECRNWE